MNHATEHYLKWPLSANIRLYDLGRPSVWIGLHLFNDDICPAGHISRPTQAWVSTDTFNQ